MDTYELKDGAVLKIEQDIHAESPREWVNLGTMVCWHSRYTLGDIQETRPYDEDEYDSLVEEYCSEGIVLNLYVYEHGGITMNTDGFSCPWDSGQIGFIFITKEKVIEEYGDYSEETRKRVEGCLKSEVKTYAQYLEGDVWGFILSKPVTCEHCGKVEDEEIDSCWGFFGHDIKENGILDHIPQEYRKELEV